MFRADHIHSHVHYSASECYTELSVSVTVEIETLVTRVNTMYALEDNVCVCACVVLSVLSATAVQCDRHI